MNHIPEDDTLATIEAIEPGWLLEGDLQIADENQEAIELYNEASNPRAILDKRELRQYQKRLKKITDYLDKHGLTELIQQYEVLKRDWQGILSQRYELKQQLENAERDERHIKSDMAILRENARSIKRDYKQLERLLKPHRKLIILQREIQARIDEHVQALKDEELNKRKRARLREEANAIGVIIIRAMNGLDFCFKTSKNGKERIISIKFGRVIVTPETIQYQILTGERGLFGGFVWQIPQGVNLIHAMSQSSVLAQISAGIRMIATCPQVETGNWHEGVWIFVHRNNFTNGLKDKVLYRDYIKRYPEDNKDLIPLPTGVKEGLWVSWTNLANQPHLLITGQTGSGKSNTILSWINTLITKHSPDEIRLILIDLKEGVDFYAYKGIPHLIGDVIEDAEGAARVLVALEQLRASRMQQLKEAGERNINNFNKRHPYRRMPHIAVFIDEFGAFASGANKEFSKTAYNIASQIAMKGRAAGTHLIIGAQTPSKHHIPPDVRDNIVLRLGGRQGSQYGAIVAGGSKAMYELPNIPGRFILQEGADSYEVQLPFITDEEIDAGILTAMTWGAPTIQIPFLQDVVDSDEPLTVVLETNKPVKPEVTMETFIEACLFLGKINYRAVSEYLNDIGEYQNLSRSDSQRFADELTEGTRVQFRDETYIVVKERHIRKLVKAEPIPAIRTEDVSVYAENSRNDLGNGNEQ